jgi:hypothetical protein
MNLMQYPELLPKETNVKDLIQDMEDSFSQAKAINEAYDTLFGPVRSTTSKRVIDLRNRTYDIHLERDPVRGEVWTAIDRVTFDYDPESRMHLQGTGRSTTEAVTDLLEKIAEAELAERIKKRTPMRMVYSSPFEPPEFESVRSSDPDERDER